MAALFNYGSLSLLEETGRTTAVLEVPFAAPVLRSKPPVDDGVYYLPATGPQPVLYGAPAPAPSPSTVPTGGVPPITTGVPSAPAPSHSCTGCKSGGHVTDVAPAMPVLQAVVTAADGSAASPPATAVEVKSSSRMWPWWLALVAVIVAGAAIASAVRPKK